MTKSMVTTGLLAAMLCLTGGLFGQDEKAKGTLPQGWGRLGLSDEQKQKIYTIQGDYKVKISDLQAKVKDLERSRNAEMSKVLSADQKAKLKEMISTKAGDEAPKKADKKKEEKKEDKKQ